MKKILYVVMAALVLVACNPNEPKVVSKDKKMLDKASQEVISLIGQKKKAVVKALEEAGFVEIEKTTLDPIAERHGVTKRQFDESFQILYFAYNPGDEDWEGLDAMDVDDIAEFIESIVEAKKVYLELQVVFDEGLLVGIQGNIVAGKEIQNINQLYLLCSKNIYNSCSDEKKWDATIYETYADYDAEKNAKTFSGDRKREKFETAISSAEPTDGLYVDETISDHNEEIDNNVFASLGWNNPDEDQVEMMEDNDFLPYIYGFFYFGLD